MALIYNCNVCTSNYKAGDNYCPNCGTSVPKFSLAALKKETGAKKTHAGAYTGKPWWGVEYWVVKLNAATWELSLKVDEKPMEVFYHNTLAAALESLLPLKAETLTTTNMLNPEAGEIPIPRYAKGVVYLDPAYNTYHEM